METPSFLLFLLLLLSFSPSPTTAGKCNKSDKRALLAIKASFNNGDSFPAWTNASACCDWYGIDCDPGIADGRVTGIRIFADPTSSGSIPSALGDLPFLTTILFHKLPGLVGTIPPSLTRLSRLFTLLLSWNSLSGPIPAFLGQIPSLFDLDLSFNKFHGSIPPELSLLQNLGALHLDRNQLTGSIPASFAHFNKSSPPDLYLSHNNLSGEVPPELGAVAWGIIDLSRNRLGGDPSVLFGEAKPTTTIDLSRNLFVFDLSRVTFPVNLALLDLNHNQITGSIPAQLNQVTGLVVFNVSYNRLCGEIPVGAVTANFGADAFFHNKCLCGSPLPAC
ncbi:Polygalacturonase inhibitor 1 [Platanthera zijinensis]|uniref:Polygalacturonase inhibitor 1 n=1 Tax=Platanthera zijinensis TaxID=2320716 RepID=A0AAP0B050_9ASPA